MFLNPFEFAEASVVDLPTNIYLKYAVVDASAGRLCSFFSNVIKFDRSSVQARQLRLGARKDQYLTE